MAVIDKYAIVERSFRGAQQISSLAQSLLASSGPIPFRTLQSRLDSMRETYLGSINVMLSLGNAAQVNPVIATFYAGSVPADAYAQFQAIGTALLAFYQAYDVVFDTLTPIDFAPATGHVYADIPLNQLSTLADELNAVVTAAAPLL